MNEQQVCEVRRRRSRHEVEQLVAEFESSGLNRSEFCRERGVGLSTLARYRRRREEQAPAGSNRLLAVEVSGRTEGPAATSSALAVVLRGGRRVEVGRGFDAGTLEQLVHVLEGV
jgi:transposase-like protein